MQITKRPHDDNDTFLFPSLGHHCCWRALCEPAHYPLQQREKAKIRRM